MVTKVYLIASERSGTNLLRKLLLENFNDIAAPPPLHIFKHAYHGFHLLPHENRSSKIRILVDSALAPWDKNIVDEIFSELDFASEPAALFSSIYETYAKIMGKSTVLIKENSLFPLVDKLSTLPDASFINLVRDPRDVVSSQINRPGALRSVIHYSKIWRKEQLESVGLQWLPNQHSLLKLQYEEMVADTRGTLSRLAEFLGAQISNKAIDFRPEADIHEWKNLNSEINVSSVQIYQERLSRRQVNLIENVVQDIIEYYGYNLVSSPRKLTMFDLITDYGKGYLMKKKTTRTPRTKICARL